MKWAIVSYEMECDSPWFCGVYERNREVFFLCGVYWWIMDKCNELTCLVHSTKFLFLWFSLVLIQKGCMYVYCTEAHDFCILIEMFFVFVSCMCPCELLECGLVVWAMSWWYLGLIIAWKVDDEAARRRACCNLACTNGLSFFSPCTLFFFIDVYWCTKGAYVM